MIELDSHLPLTEDASPTITHLLKYRGQSAALTESPPAGNSGVGAHQQVLRAGQTDRGDVVGELERRLQLDQCQIVFVGEEVVLGVDDLFAHAPLHIRQLLLDVREVVLAHSDAYLVGQQAAGEEESGREVIQLLSLSLRRVANWRPIGNN